MIPVTKTFFPKIEKYQSQLERVWANEWLTNRGELVKELESKLRGYLDVPNITLTTNGTLPLQIALKALGKGGDIITTPFSYVATTSSIVWENCKPVFVDIHPEYLTIDVSKIENAITKNSTAILATHVFGNPCDVIKIEEIAQKHNLKVIYDAAHCFGVQFNGNSLFNYGDVSTCSFHATKLFHTGEGGGIFCSDDDLNHRLYFHHNFGHNGPNDFHGVGINAKMSELQAAMGLSVFPHMREIIQYRKGIVEYYSKNIDFTKVSGIKIREGTNWNYSYYPIIFKDEESLLLTVKKLHSENIHPRRYFYPSLNTLNYLDDYHEMIVSESISKRILCLPLYYGLLEQDLIRIKNIINE